MVTEEADSAARTSAGWCSAVWEERSTCSARLKVTARVRARVGVGALGRGPCGRVFGGERKHVVVRRVLMSGEAAVGDVEGLRRAATLQAQSRKRLVRSA